MPNDERLRVRVDELLECADHTLKTFEEAAALYKLQPLDDARQARLDARLNAAEAGAFQLRRRGLSVQDATSGGMMSNSSLVVSTLNTLEACRCSIEKLVQQMRSPGAAPQDDSLKLLRRNFATLRDYANQLASQST